MAKVSVVIPVYGVEKYIKKCAISLFEQTLDDIEYIFVNDCTPDRSLEILQRVLDKYPQRKAFTRIINMPINSGQAEVRKRGVWAATGDYIIQCDSDDWIAPNMYEEMYKYAINGDYDIVRCNFTRTDGLKYKNCYHTNQSIYVNKDTLISYTLRGCDLSSTWDKLVRRELYQSASFLWPKDNMCEDYAIIIQLFLASNKIGYIDKVLYFYYQNMESISNKVEESHFDNKCRQIMSNIALIENVLINPTQFNKELESMKFMAKSVYKPLIYKRSVYNKWRNVYPEINVSILFNKFISQRTKIGYIACLLGLYYIIKKYHG